jgi:hypothetical protein
VPITCGVALGAAAEEGEALGVVDVADEGETDEGLAEGVDPALGSLPLPSFPPHAASTSIPPVRRATSRNMVRG